MALDLDAIASGTFSAPAAARTDGFGAQRIAAPDQAGGYDLNSRDGIKTMLRDVAESRGIDPDLFVALADRESSLNPQAKNPKSSAKGLFQFIDGTARQYGIDGKQFDPQANAMAAADLLQDNLKQFGGDYSLALAAHHVGAKKAQRALADASVGDVDVSTQQWLGDIYKRAGRQPDAPKFDPVGRVGEIRAQQAAQKAEKKDEREDAQFAQGLAGKDWASAGRDVQSANGGDGDFVRSVKNYMPQMREMFGAIQTMGGVTAKKIGMNDLGDSMILGGIERMEAAKGEQVSKDTDEFTGAWEKGGLGAVITDWLPYQAGQAVGNAGEAILASLAGAGAGAAVGGPAAPITGATGAVGGILFKTLARKGVVEAAQKIAMESGQAAANTFLKREAGKLVGTNAAVATMAAYHGAGETGSRIIDEMTKQGIPLENIDLGRYAQSALGHTFLEFIGDKISLGALSKPLEQARTGVAGVAKDAAQRGVSTGLKEAPVEVGQTAAERYGAGLDLTSPDAQKEYLNAGAAAVGMGGVTGGAGAVFQRAVSKPLPPNSPLQAAAQAGNSAGGGAAVLDGAAPDAGGVNAAAQPMFGDAQLDQMHSELASFMGNREAIASLRELDPNMPGDAFHVWKNVINNTDLPLQTRIKALTQAYAMLKQRPNFTMGSNGATEEQQQPSAGGALAAMPQSQGGAVDIPGRVIDGESRQVGDAPAIAMQKRLQGPVDQRKALLAQAVDSGAQLTQTPDGPVLQSASQLYALSPVDVGLLKQLLAKRQDQAVTPTPQGNATTAIPGNTGDSSQAVAALASPVVQPAAAPTSDALQALQAKYDAAKAAGDNAAMRALAPQINAEKQKAIEAAQPKEQAAAKPQTPFALGTSPGDAELITVRDGVVYHGRYSADDFETGDPVRVADDATPHEIAQALRDAGYVGNGLKFFGLPKGTTAPKAVQETAPAAAEQTEAPVAQERAAEEPSTPQPPAYGEDYSVHNAWQGKHATDQDGKRIFHPYEPNAWHTRLMDLVSQALDAGKFYTTDVDAFVKNALGDSIPAAAYASNSTNVEGGDLGYEIYKARQKVEAQRVEKANADAFKALGLHVGQQLGTLMFNDFKVSRKATVEAIEGNKITLSLKRGKADAILTTDPLAIAAAIERADSKGLRGKKKEDAKPAEAIAAEPAVEHRAKIDALSDAAVSEVFDQANLAGKNASPDEKRAMLRDEPAEEIAPLLPEGTAPEHAHNEGKPLDPTRKYDKTAAGPVTQEASVDESIVPFTMSAADFKEVTDEWASLFANPEGGRVNIGKKAGSEYMTVEEAKEKIDGWKAHVDSQFANHRGENFDKTVLSLFDLSGEWSKPWEEAGYNVIRFDIQSGQDVHDFSVEYFTENYDISNVYAILAACPCTDFASSGARWFKDKDADGRTEASKELVFKTMQTIEYFRPAIWALENPVGRIGNLTGLPDSRMSFDPNNFGDPYTKKTMIWGNFNADLPTANVDPVEGSKMWSKYGGKSQATKNARSETPEGFAYAFFMANNYLDMPAEQKLVAQYPEASGAIKQALKAGISEARIHELMDDTYGNYEYEDARNALIREVAAVTHGEKIAEAAEATDDNPSEAQKEAGNYAKGHFPWNGLDITLETTKGAERSGKSEDGQEWRVTMPHHYGYIKGTIGADKDHADVFMGDHPESDQVWIVNQTKPNSQEFDEHKALLGFENEGEARAAYLKSFSGDFGDSVLGSVSGPYSVEEFKALLPDFAHAKPIDDRKVFSAKRLQQDPNIGREWNSEYGRQRIVERQQHPTGDLYHVQTVEDGTKRNYRVDDIENVIAQNEHKLTPEYAAEVAERAEVKRLQDERRQKEQERAAADDADIAAFTKGMTPMAAGKYRAALLVTASADGRPITRKALIEEKVAEGRVIGEYDGARTLETQDGAFLSEKKLTKAGMDYAAYLIAKRDGKPLADIQVQAPVLTPEGETVYVDESADVALADLDSDLNLMRSLLECLAT